MTGREAMTLDEARRIRRQDERGVLDLALPGTADVVCEAERVCTVAALWGATPAERRRSAWGVAGITTAVLSVVGVCLVPLPL